MIQPATLPWFARHEISLVWRDWVYMMTAGNRRREKWITVALFSFAAFVHLLAYMMIAPFVDGEIAPDKRTLVMVTGTALLAWSLMLSQAMESVTRAFYARADLDLILSSPASARRVFAIRIGAIALSTTMLSMLLAGPFINMMALTAGYRWLFAYGVLCAMGAVSAAFAVTVTITLFRTLGPKRTRLVSQIVAAVVGAGFVIGIQAVAILTYGTFTRLDILRSEIFVSIAPDVTSIFWWPARAAMGEVWALGVVLGIGTALLFMAIAACAGRFGDDVAAAAGVAFNPKRSRRRKDSFRQASTKRALRRKEWTLLRRDPWLMSQTLMQVLYLLPPALLLWRNFEGNIGTLPILVPVLVMASGQLAGGLAWLAVSGEDAPELVATAPVPPHSIIAAKIEAVLIAVVVIVGPLLIALAIASPRTAVVAAIGISLAAMSATMIQIWFRAQAKRSHFRRRQTSSRIATLSEAFSSILWAATAGLAAAGTWFAVAAAVLALSVLFFVRLVRPKTEGVV